MRKDNNYKAEINLNHNESPAKVNMETGEVVIVKKQSKEDKNFVRFQPNSNFSKSYNNSWKWLYYRTSPLEYKVAHFLSQKTSPTTNSLMPLSDSSTVTFLSNEFDISLGKVKLIFNKLFELGVFAKFEISERNQNKQYTKYWIFNPYLSFTGSKIPVAVLEMFKNTEIAYAFES